MTGCAPIFSELAEKFTRFVDVLSEVSDRSGTNSSTDLLRLYEKWLRTRSPRNGDLLLERGIVPNQLADHAVPPLTAPRPSACGPASHRRRDPPCRRR